MPDMRKIGRQISIFMGITLSFFLSLTGNLMGGHFSVVPWLISFVISSVISLIIGFVVPMGKISQSVHKKHGNTIKAKLLESLYSDLIYTPIITICMVLMARVMATRMAEAAGGTAELPPVAMQLISSLVVCLVVGYILIFIFQPIYMKIVFKKNGVTQGGPPTGAGAPPTGGPENGRPPMEK